MKFLRSPYARVLTLVLLLQCGVFYALAMRAEKTPPIAPLSTFPLTIGEYHTLRVIDTPKEVLDILKADDTVTREYIGSARTPILFYVAYFNSQRYGQAPHSPKNCLPGEGWEPVESNTIDVAVPGWSAPIAINHFVVEHGDDREVTLYWYQSHNRVIAHEFAAKFWLVADSMRYNRSDSALVRIIVPVAQNDVDGATQIGVNFVKAMFPSLVQHLPA